MFAQRSACAPTTIAGLSPVMSSRRNSHSPTITEEATMASPLRVSRSSRGNVPMQGIVVQLAGHDDPEEGVQVAQLKISGPAAVRILVGQRLVV